MHSFNRSLWTSLTKCRSIAIFKQLHKHFGTLILIWEALFIWYSWINYICLPLPLIQVSKGMKFMGGESAALSRVHEYFWKKAWEILIMNCYEFLIWNNFYNFCHFIVKEIQRNIDCTNNMSYYLYICTYIFQDLLRIYKHTRNGMLGSDYSTKFSPWLASGSLSPRFVHEEVGCLVHLYFFSIR